MGRREELVRKIQELMRKPEHIRNMGIVAHIDQPTTRAWTLHRSAAWIWLCAS